MWWVGVFRSISHRDPSNVGLGVMKRGGEEGRWLLESIMAMAAHDIDIDRLSLLVGTLKLGIGIRCERIL